MAQYQIFVGADTKSATNQLQRLDKVVTGVTKARELAIKVPNVKTFERQIRSATNNAVKGLKSVVKNADNVKGAFDIISKAANPSTFLAGSFKGANAGAQSLLDRLARLTVVLYGVNAAVGVLQRSFMGFFNATIGEANRFEESLLRTKTTLASTSDVFLDGKKITDPLKAIESLTGVIDERIESIRLRTIDIAGVTSGEVVEVFSIVASQAGQIGASLEDAENLAISFAAALGTFGLPLRQARQEITSILQGNVNVDSYLAQALQITNEDISKARSQIGGITKFLEDRLATAVAGQAIAAKTLGGVLSNIRDIWEEFTRAIGTPLLAPLVAGVDAFYTTLKNSLTTIKAIGAAFGQVFATIARGAAGAAGFGGLDQSRITEAQKATATLLNNLQAQFSRLNNALEGLFTRIQGQLGTIFDNLGGQVAMIGEAFAKLGEAVLVLTNAQIESFVGAIAQLIPILTGAVAGVTSLIKVWAELLKLPIVQSFVRIQTTFKVLEKTGIMGLATMITKFVLFRKAILASIAAMWKLATTVKRAIGIIVLAFGKVLVAITMLIAKLTALGLKFGIISKKMAAELTKLSAQMLVLGNNAKATGASMQTLGSGVNFVTRAFAGLLKTTIVLAAVQLAIVGIVEAISLWQRKQAEIARKRELETAIEQLDKTAEKAAKGGLTSLEKKLNDIAQQKINSEIDRLAEEIFELDKKLKELDERRNSDDVYIDYSLDTDTDQTQSKREKLVQELEELRAKLQDKQTEKDVEVRAKESKKLEKELAELRKSLADDEFRYRQRLASAEVDRFRIQTQLELQRMQKSLQARLKGEEGISRLFMERLNDYLLTKKRGEDEIAERQQRLNITLANLQKEIADYKYNTEKKIAALQEKMGKFQMEVADYKLNKMKEQASASSGGQYNGEFGNDAIGKLTAAIVSKESGGDYNAVNKDSGAIGIGQVMPENVGPWTMKYYGEHLTAEAYKSNPSAQNAVVRGRIKDSYLEQTNQGYSPEEAARRVAAEWYSGQPGLHTSTRKQYSNGNEYPSISEYADDIVKRMGTSAGTPAAKPESPDWNLEDVDTSGVTASLQQLQKVLADINALKDELTQEQIAEKFVNITEGLFGDIALEPLQDQLQKASDLFDKTANSADRLTDATKREIEYQVEVNRKTQERDAVLQKIADNTEISAEKKAALEAKITEEYNNHIDKLGQAEDLKRKILATTQAQLALERMVAETKALEEQTQGNMLRMRLEMEGLSDIEIQGELKKAQYAREYAKAMKEAEEAGDPKKVEALRKAWEGLSAAIDKSTNVQLEARNPLRQLYTQWKKDLSDVNAYYAQMAQVVQTQIAQALSSAIIGAIEGTTTVKEAFANMFKAIGKAFIDMATQMIAKALVMRVLGIFLPGAGGGFNMGTTAMGAGGGSVGGIGTLGPNFGFQVGAAQGAYVNRATPALIGEGGSPEYVIPENKMAASMTRWAQGMRGKGVVEGADSSFGSQNRSGSQPTALGDVSKRFNPGNNYSAVNNYNGSDSAADQYSINITGEQLVFNEKNYVSQDELPGIISQASKQGEARTLRKLRMSQGTRQRLGI